MTFFGAWRGASRWSYLLGAFVLLSFSSACHRRSADSSRSPLSSSTSIVARVDGFDIALESLRAEAARRGMDSSSAPDLAALLDERLHFQLVLSEAHRTGFDQDPATKEKWERFLVGRFLEEREKNVSVGSTNDWECRVWYNQHRDQFRFPERVNLALVHVRVPSNADAERREAARRRVGDLRARAEAEAGQARHFGAVAMENSDHQESRYKGGEVGWLTREQAENLLGVAVAEVAFGLTDAGQISPVIETDEGFDLLKLIEHKEAGIRPFEEVREMAAERMNRERMAESREALYTELRSRSAVEINERLIENLRKSDAPARPEEPPRLPAQ